MIKEYAFPATFVRSLIHFRSLRVTKGARVIAPLYTPLGFTTTHINSHQLTITHCNCLHFLHFLHFLPLSPTFSTFRRATLGVDSKVTVPNSWGTPHRDLVVLNAHLEVLSVASRCHGKMEKWKNDKRWWEPNLNRSYVHRCSPRWHQNRDWVIGCQNSSLSFLTPKQCSSMDQVMFLKITPCTVWRRKPSIIWSVCK